MSRLSFSLTSRSDLHEIYDFIARDKPNAALSFVVELKKTCRTLADSPQIGTARDDLAPNLRCFSVENYVIYFRPWKKGIEIARVLHGARETQRISFD